MLIYGLSGGWAGLSLFSRFMGNVLRVLRKNIALAPFICINLGPFFCTEPFFMYD